MNKDYLEKMIQQLMDQDIPTTSIRFFESILFKYAGVYGAESTLHSECGSYVL